MSGTYGVMYKDEMIRAYIKEQKTQTRRLKGLEIVNKNPADWELFGFLEITSAYAIFQSKLNKKQKITIKAPYGSTSNTLWFKECYRAWEDQKTGEDFLLYRADNGKFQPFASDDPSWNLICGKFDKWHSSMFMPHWASRFWDVPIVSVRVERLHDITEADARAEGVTVPENTKFPGIETINARLAYFDLWDEINGKTMPRQANPYVWVYEFPKYDPEQVSKIHPHVEEKP